MNFKKSMYRIGLLVAGMLLIAAPINAQQEVSPDHFDATDVARQKPAVQHRKSASTQKKSVVSHVAQGKKSNSAIQPSVTAKSEPATIALDAQHR